MQDCEYRDGDIASKDRTASCRLPALLSSLADQAATPVNEAVCEACGRHKPPSPSRLNPVVASLLFRLTRDIIAEGGRPDCSVERARELQTRAEQHLRIVRLPTGGAPTPRLPLACCDVILCCADASPRTEQAIRSVLEQQDAVTWLHLVDETGAAGPLLAKYDDSPYVIVHRDLAGRGNLRALQQLVPQLRTQFVAIQDAATISHPRRIADSVGALTEQGAELLLAALQTPDRIWRPQRPGGTYRRTAATSTLVIRRASLVDMGGIADRPGDEDLELLYRAVAEGRQLILSPHATVELTAANGRADPPLGPPPCYELRDGVLRHHALGFPAQRVACDVVLPFHGKLAYVREALTSVLEQHDCDVVVHLIDDASPEPVEDFLRTWNRHPQVRVYRNRRNIGQFKSFNNVFPYLETDLVAVQDADDRSRPNRLALGGNALRLAAADIFGSAIQYFGEPVQLAWTDQRRESPVYNAVDRRPRPSRYPSAAGGGSFLINGTAILQVRAFRALNGFSDFRDNLRNKSDLDTEFYARAFCSHLRFAITKQLLLDCRRHPDSATQNCETGWGSSARVWSQSEVRKRRQTFSTYNFDAFPFGALHEADMHTEKYEDK